MTNSQSCCISTGEFCSELKRLRYFRVPIGMSRTARTIYHSGWVLMISGLVLIFVPDQVALFFWKDTVPDFWLRTLGYFMFIEGLISYKSSYYEVNGLYRWIINYRMLQPAFFTTLLIVDFANPGLMLYSTIELILGIYSFLAFKQDNL